MILPSLKSKPVLIGVGVLVLILIGAAAYVQLVVQPQKTKSNPSVQTAVPSAPSEPLPASSLTQTYAEPGMGYAIMFPEDWVVGKTETGTKSVILTGKEGSPAYGATIVIQNLLTKKTDGVYEDVRAASEDLKSQLRTQATEVQITEEAPIAYTTTDNKKVEGTQWYAEFKASGTPFKQLQIVLTHPNQAYLHSIAFAAPANVYTAVEATARAIVQSFVMSEEAFSATSTTAGTNR